MSENETNEPAIAEPSDVMSDELAGETKKRPSRGTVVLGVLFLAALGGLALMHMRAGPSTAQASSEAAMTVNSFLGDGKKNLASMQANLNDTDKLVAQFRAFPAAAQVPLEDLKRNPFSDTKSGMKPVDQNANADRQAKLTEALKHVGTLKLQSIMFSETNRSCMIDGKFRAENDAFDDFVVERINASSVIVKTAGFRFELKVKN